MISTILRADFERGRERRARYRAQNPMSDLPWTVAEDRRLLRAIAKNAARLRPLTQHDFWTALHRRFGRSTCALQTRLYALRAGMRLRDADRGSSP